jgi:hypothetical protein
MPLTVETYSGHELVARAAIAAALISSKSASVPTLDFSKYWTDATNLRDLGIATDGILKTIAEKR